jgi:hypothetical protein
MSEIDKSTTAARVRFLAQEAKHKKDLERETAFRAQLEALEKEHADWINITLHSEAQKGAEAVVFPLQASPDDVEIVTRNRAGKEPERYVKAVKPYTQAEAIDKLLSSHGFSENEICFDIASNGQIEISVLLVSS